MESRVNLLKLNSDYVLNSSNSGFSYHLFEVLGYGGSSIVYRAFYLLNGIRKNVLIKELFPLELSANHRLVREDNGNIRVNTQLPLQESEKAQVEYDRYINIAEVEQETINKLRISIDGKTTEPYFFEQIDQFRANGTVYSVLLSEDGETLSSMIQRHESGTASDLFSNLDDILQCGLRILEALTPVHNRKYLHLDIAPDNIYFSKMSVNGLHVARLIDFNSAYDLIGIAERKETISYKLGYSAYELSPIVNPNDRKLSFATDLFSVVAVLFRLIKGCSTENIKIERINTWKLSSDIPVLRKASEDVIDELNAFFRKGLSNSPMKRFQTIDELKNALLNLIAINSNKYFLLNKYSFANAIRNFVGRSHEIEYVNQHLSHAGYAILTGVGGMGKTSIVSKYVQDYRSQYDTIIALTCNRGYFETVISDVDFPIKGLRRMDEETSEAYYSRKLGIFKQLADERTLLIIDNLDAIEGIDLDEILSLGCKIIITSRADIGSLGLESCSVECMAFDDAATLFRQYVNDVSEDDSLKALFERTGYHTMAIELIAKQIAITGKSLQQYLDSLDNSCSSCWNDVKVRHMKDGRVSSDTVLNLIKAILNIADLTDNQRSVLCALCLCPTTGINKSDFIQIYEAKCVQEIEDLRFWGWITTGTDKKIYVHPVVAEAVNSYREETGEDIAPFINNVNNVLLSDNSVLRSILLQKIELGEAVLRRSGKIDPLVAIKYANNLGELYRLSGQYDRAYDYLSKAKNQITQHGYDNELINAIVTNNYALVCIKLNRYTEALMYFDIAIKCVRSVAVDEGINKCEFEVVAINNQAICHRAMGDVQNALGFHFKAKELLKQQPHSDILEAYLDAAIADTYTYLGDFDKAFKFYADAFKTYESQYGLENFKTIRLCINIAVAYSKSGKYKEAISQYKSILTVMKSIGCDDVELASLYKKISVAYWRRRLYDLAEKYCVMALEVEDAMQLPERLSSLNNLAKICAEKKEYEKSIKYYGEILKNLDSSCSPELVCTVFENIAQIFIITEEYEEALTWCKEAFEIYCGFENIPQLACSNLLNSMGYIYYCMGELDKAISYYEKSNEIKRRLRCLKTLEAAAVYHNQGLAYYKKGDYKRSKERSLSAVYLRETLLETPDLSLADSYQNVAIAASKLLQLEEAIKYGHKDLELRRSLVGRENSSVAVSQRNLGSYYYEFEKYEEALVHFLDSLHISAISNLDSPQVLAVVCHMVGECYSKIGNEDKAKYYFAKSEQYAEE